MHLTNVIVSSIVITASFANAFKNTAPLIIQLNNEPLEQLSYVTFEDSLPICSVLSSRKNLVVQIPNLSHQDLTRGQSQLPHVSKLVAEDIYKLTPFYKYNDKVTFGCDKKLQTVDIESFDDEEWINVLQNLDDKTDEIIVFKFPTLSHEEDLRFEELNKIDSFISLITSTIEGNDQFRLIVQGLPKVNKVTELQLMGALNNLLNHKRRSADIDIDYDKVKQEVDEAFKEVEQMLENEADGLVSITNSTTTDGGLFEHYQFFTPGIWMGTIVSFFLLSILIILFQWLASLQISYKSFEKQVSLQKKTQ